LNSQARSLDLSLDVAQAVNILHMRGPNKHRSARSATFDLTNCPN
jgi:hypothetical protein